MEITLCDADPEDPRLTDAGPAPAAWRDERGLLIAVRRAGPAPLLLGTASGRLRGAGDGIWAVRLEIPRVRGACIEWGIWDESARGRTDRQIWRDPGAQREAAETLQEVEDARPVGGSAIARLHPARLWSAPDPEALLVCADGEGLSFWAGVIAAAGQRVALAGIDSAGLGWVPGTDHVYDAAADPRARAYLRSVATEEFDEHLRYVLEDVIPWAEERVGRLPRILFGVSNGAAWAAQAAAIHPREFAGVLAFSVGVPPERPPSAPAPPHALVAGRFEPGFCTATSAYARKLRRRAVPVRLRRPARGHDSSMWADELVPALRWVRERI